MQPPLGEGGGGRKISPPKLSGSRVSSEARQVAGWVRAGSRFQKPERRKGSPLSPLRVSFRQRAAAWPTAVNAAVEREREREGGLRGSLHLSRPESGQVAAWEG